MTLHIITKNLPEGKMAHKKPHHDKKKTAHKDMAVKEKEAHKEYQKPKHKAK